MKRQGFFAPEPQEERGPDSIENLFDDLEDQGKEENRGGVFEELDDEVRAFLEMDPDLVLHVGSRFLIRSLILGHRFVCLRLLTLALALSP